MEGTLPRKNIQAAIEFERTHRRAKGPPGYPLRGFGDGSFTLYLMPSRTVSRTTFRDGKPVTETVESHWTPELESMRLELLRTLRERGGIFYISTALLDYAATLIRLSYEVSDDDLTMLLCSGNAWHASITEHLCGGEGFEKAVQQLEKLAKPDAPTAPVKPLRPVKKRSLFARLTGR